MAWCYIGTTTKYSTLFFFFLVSKIGDLKPGNLKPGNPEEKEHLETMFERKSRWVMRSAASIVILWMILVVLFPIGIGTAFRDAGVNKHATKQESAHCSCDCWDGQFKGPYGRGGYKSIFFNMDWGTSILLLVVSIYLSLGQSLVARVLALGWLSPLGEGADSRPNWAMFLCTIASIFPNFYGFWMTFNYINDRFYRMWWTQMFFTVSEMVVGMVAYHLIERKFPYSSVETRGMKIVIAIAASHFVLSGTAQGFSHVLMGRPGQISRDILFGIGDLAVMGLTSHNLRGSLKGKFKRACWQIIGYFCSLLIVFSTLSALDEAHAAANSERFDPAVFARLK
jgi:hypothetical protein